MPQLSNITLGSAVSLTATDNKLFRVVPAPANSKSNMFEHSEVGQPELATRISASTTRLQNGKQSTLLRLTAPIIRSIEGAQTRVGADIVEITVVSDRASTAQERQEVVNTAIRALTHAFFKSVIVDGEAMT